MSTDRLHGLPQKEHADNLKNQWLIKMKKEEAKNSMFT